MANEVVIPLSFKAEKTGLVKATQGSQQSLKELQKEINKTNKSYKDAEKQTSSFSQELKDQIPVINNLSGAVSRFAKSPAGIVAGLGAIAVGTGKLVTAQAAYINEIGRFVPITNASIEALSQYELVAARTSTSFDKITDGFFELTLRLGEGTKDTREAIDALGLSFDDLAKQEADVAFEEIVDALNNVDSAARRAALAEAVFGGAAEELAAVIDIGADSIRAIRAEADLYGGTLSEDVLDDSRRFNEELTRFTAIASSAGASIAGDLLGPAADFLGWLVDSYEATQDTVAQIRALTNSFVDLGAAFLGLEKEIEIIEKIERSRIYEELKEDVEDAEAAVERWNFKLLEGTEIQQFLNDKLSVAKQKLNEFEEAARKAAKEAGELRRKADEAAEGEENLGDKADEKTRAIKDQAAAFEDHDEHIREFERSLKAAEKAEKELAESIKQDLVAAEIEAQKATEVLVDQIDGFDKYLPTFNQEVEESSEAIDRLTGSLVDVAAAFAGAALSSGSLRDGLSSALPLLGRAGGQFLGSQVPFVGEKIGGALGSFLGGALGGVFGGKDKKPTIKLQTRGGDFDTPLGATGDTGFELSSELADLLLVGSGGRRVPGGQELLRAIEALDNRIASTLTPDQLSSARDAASFNAKDAASAFDFEQRLIERARAIFDGIGGKLNEAFDLLASEADLTAAELGNVIEGIVAVNDAITDGTISEYFPGAVDDVIAKITELADENETIVQTYNRVVTETLALTHALDSIGVSSTDVGVTIATAVVDMIGGIDRLQRLTNTFRSEFLSEAQITKLDQAIAQSSIDAFLVQMEELGLTVDLTRDGFADFVLGLDLTTEAGQKAYVAALEVADSLDLVLDAREAEDQIIVQGITDLGDLTGKRETEVAAISGTTEGIDTMIHGLDELRVTADDVGDGLDGLGEILNDKIPEGIKEITRAADDFARSVDSIVASQTATFADRRFAKIPLVGERFGGDLSESIGLDITRLSTERQRVVAEQRAGIPGLPSSHPQVRDRDRLYNELLARIDSEIADRRALQGHLDFREARLPGLGEERLVLELEFERLYNPLVRSDLDPLLEQERAAAQRLFDERWAAIVEAAQDPVPDVEPPTAPGIDIEAIAQDYVGNITFFGAKFSDSFRRQLEIDASRLQAELAGIEPGPATDRIIELLAERLSDINTSMRSIDLLQRRFPGLGEQRFLLMREFEELFDGSVLTDAERQAGMAEFESRWADIVRKAAENVEDVVLGPLERISGVAGDLSTYLSGLLLGDLSTLPQARQLELAEQDFFDLIARARESGDVTTAQLTNAHQDLAREIRDSFGFGPEATNRFAEATAALAELGEEIAIANDNQTQVDQLQELRNLVEEMRLTRQAIQSQNRQRAL